MYPALCQTTLALPPPKGVGALTNVIGFVFPRCGTLALCSLMLGELKSTNAVVTLSKKEKANLNNVPHTTTL